MRLGEVLALQPGDLDGYTRTIRIARAFSQDGDSTPRNQGTGEQWIYHSTLLTRWPAMH